MNGFGIGFKRDIRWRILLWLPTLLFCSWTLVYLARERRMEHERAVYEGFSIEEWINQAMQETYYSSHWATFEEPTLSMADRMVITIGAPAVPAMVERLRGLHVGSFHYKLIELRRQLWPSFLPSGGILAEPSDVSGDVAHLNYLLSRMGEAARPAVPAMLDSAADLHVWAELDLLDDFVRLGGVAREALPTLRKWASAGGEAAALAVKLIEQGKVYFADLEEYELLAKPAQDHEPPPSSIRRKATDGSKDPQ